MTTDSLIIILGLETSPNSTQSHAVAAGHDPQRDATNHRPTHTHGTRYVEVYLGGGGRVLPVIVAVPGWRPSTCWLR